MFYYLNKTNDFRYIYSLDVHAAVLYKTQNTKELEKLIAAITPTPEYTAEHYVAMAYALYAARKFGRASTLIVQAINLNPYSIEAIILWGNIFIELKKYQEALHHFRKAALLKPHRYEPHKGLVDCYVGMHRLREALNIASTGCKLLGHTPRALTVKR